MSKKHLDRKITIENRNLYKVYLFFRLSVRLCAPIHVPADVVFLFCFFFTRVDKRDTRRNGLKTAAAVINNSFGRAIKEDGLSESGTKSTTSLSITVHGKPRVTGIGGRRAQAVPALPPRRQPRRRPRRPVILEFQLTRTTNQTA